jgi:hypothetical protein
MVLVGGSDLSLRKSYRTLDAMGASSLPPLNALTTYFGGGGHELRKRVI